MFEPPKSAPLTYRLIKICPDTTQLAVYEGICQCCGSVYHAIERDLERFHGDTLQEARVDYLSRPFKPRGCGVCAGESTVIFRENPVKSIDNFFQKE